MNSRELLYINNVKETIELTNVVRIKDIPLFSKNRFAVLTTNRILIFNNNESFLLKKASKVFNCSLLYLNFLKLLKY